MSFLREYLAGGAKPVAEVNAEAKQRDIAPGTLKRAKQRLGVMYAKDGMSGGWTVKLPN